MGRYDLRLSEREFRRLTVQEFNALVERHNLREEKEDSRFALVCAVLANIHRGKRRPYKLEQFMPSKPKYQGHTRPRQSSETMLKMVEMLNKAFGGKDKRKK